MSPNPSTAPQPARSSPGPCCHRRAGGAEGPGGHRGTRGAQRDWGGECGHHTVPVEEPQGRSRGRETSKEANKHHQQQVLTSVLSPTVVGVSCPVPSRPVPSLLEYQRCEMGAGCRREGPRASSLAPEPSPPLWLLGVKQTLAFVLGELLPLSGWILPLRSHGKWHRLPTVSKEEFGPDAEKCLAGG